MAKILSIFFLSLLLFNGCFGSFQSQNECELNQLFALEPTKRVQYEAGAFEYWNHSAPQFQCAGVSMVRTVINSKGLLLPTYYNTPRIGYVISGRFVRGDIIPGCAETYQETLKIGRGRRFTDMFQKVEHLKQGDVFVVPAGVSSWSYNEGNVPAVVVLLFDIATPNNHLDANARAFRIAGTLSEEQQQGSGGNIFSGLDPQLIADSLKTDLETARKIRSNDGRGNIINVPGTVHFTGSPSRSSDNGLEESLCTMRFHENIDNPARADVYSPLAGRLSTVNSFDLPILRSVQLSAERGLLYSNGLVLPQWHMNAHALLYVTGGRARIQIVNDNGRSVFDDIVQLGQAVTVPQGFGVLILAQETGFEYICFKTNDDAMVNTFAGRMSYMRALPVDVVAAAYQVSEEEARKIKFNRMETRLATTSSS